MLYDDCYVAFIDFTQSRDISRENNILPGKVTARGLLQRLICTEKKETEADLL